MNRRHDHKGPENQTSRVVAQSLCVQSPFVFQADYGAHTSRAHSSIAAQLCFRAHIFNARPGSPRLPRRTRRAHLPITPSRINQEEQWTNT